MHNFIAPWQNPENLMIKFQENKQTDPMIGWTDPIS